MKFGFVEQEKKKKALSKIRFVTFSDKHGFWFPRGP